MTTFLKKPLLTTCVRSVLILSIAAPSFAGGPDKSTNPLQQQQQQQQQEATTTEPTTTVTTTESEQRRELELWLRRLIAECDKNPWKPIGQVFEGLGDLPTKYQSFEAFLLKQELGELRGMIQQVRDELGSVTLQELNELISFTQQDPNEPISITQQELNKRIRLIQEELNERMIFIEGVLADQNEIDLLNLARVLLENNSAQQARYKEISSRLEELKKKKERINKKQDELWEQFKKMIELLPRDSLSFQPLVFTPRLYEMFFERIMQTLEDGLQEQFKELYIKYLKLAGELYALQQQQPQQQQATTEATAPTTTTTTTAAAASLTQVQPTSPTTTLSSTTTTVQRPQQSRGGFFSSLWSLPF